MNSSESEAHAFGIEAAVERALPLLPEIGKLLYAGVARHADAAGLSLGQIKVLMHVYHHGRRTVGEIAGGLGVAMPTASELVDQLAAAGLVERTVNPADRRQVLVSLTPRAEAFGARLRALRRAQLRAALERLAPEERPVFVRSLEALVEGLREHPGELEDGRGSPAESERPAGPVGSGAAAPSER